MSITNALSRGAAAETAGILTKLVRIKIMEVISTLTPQQCVLFIHAVDFASCCVASCTDAEHGRARARSLAANTLATVQVPVICWEPFFVLTGIVVAFPGSTYEQLRNARVGSGSQQFYARLYPALLARLAALELQNPSPSSLRAAAAAAAEPVAARPATCTFTPCTNPVTSNLRVYEPHTGPVTSDTRFLWSCGSCAVFVQRGTLAITWTDPPTWKHLSGKNSEEQYAPLALAAPYVLDQPAGCMVTSCTNQFAGVNYGYGRKLWQFPAGPQRSAYPRFLWICCSCNNKRKRSNNMFVVDWTQFPPVARRR